MYIVFWICTKDVAEAYRLCYMIKLLLWLQSIVKVLTLKIYCFTYALKKGDFKMHGMWRVDVSVMVTVTELLFGSTIVQQRETTRNCGLFNRNNASSAQGIQIKVPILSRRFSIYTPSSDRTKLECFCYFLLVGGSFC